jgi:hypothetical protein
MLCTDAQKRKLKIDPVQDIVVIVSFEVCRGEWSVPRPGHCTSAEDKARNIALRGWVDFKTGLDDMEKFPTPTENRTLIPR